MNKGVLPPEIPRRPISLLGKAQVLGLIEDFLELATVEAEVITAST